MLIAQSSSKWCNILLHYSVSKYLRIMVLSVGLRYYFDQNNKYPHLISITAITQNNFTYLLAHFFMETRTFDEEFHF